MSAVLASDEDLELPALDGVTDSKKISANKRNHYYKIILEKLPCYTCHIGVGYIDKHGINAAIQYALYKISAQAARIYPVKEAVFDGNYKFTYPRGLALRERLPLRTEVKGDARFRGISCASVLAKVSRDKIIIESAKRFPQYGLDQHKGYGTKKHMTAIQNFGLTKFHRKSFLKKYFSTGQP